MATKIGMIFPGQGSQSVGMLADLAEECAELRPTFAEASEVLGYDLWELTQRGPIEELNQTEKTQPAMLAADVAIYRCWMGRTGLEAVTMAGHSLGEYAALVAADALSFRDAVALVRERGRLMQEAVPQGEGAMAAIIGLSDAEVQGVCSEVAAPQVAEPVNYNSPGQVVIAGSAGGVAEAMERAKQAGAKRALPLPVSVPSHSSLMEPAAHRLAAVLDGIAIDLPRIPVVHNVDARTCDDVNGLRDRLVRQLHNPVRWTETVQHMAGLGVTHLLEVGPGKVLSGLVKRTAREIETMALGDIAGFHKARDILHA
jgi:[acyl-carrier-protein] S-malonyltransferase